MNSKQAKRIRRVLRMELRALGADETIKGRWNINTIPTMRGTTITLPPNADGERKVMEDTAIQIRLAPESTRSIYKRIKERVQANRTAA